jgi:hypothetical protein
VPPIHRELFKAKLTRFTHLVDSIAGRGGFTKILGWRDYEGESDAAIKLLPCDTEVMGTASYRNIGKCYIHKTQSGQTPSLNPAQGGATAQDCFDLSRLELCAPG